MELLRLINYVIMILFTICYAYQFAYIPVAWFTSVGTEKMAHGLFTSAGTEIMAQGLQIHRFAILICGRNEEAVIGHLIGSIRKQNYPADQVEIFVMADNCTDRTAEVAEKAGAHVYTRLNHLEIGKGYALQLLLQNIRRDYPENFDAFLVFDADNLLDRNYLAEMNRTFCQGHEIITSYRNSKNYGSNWVSAGYALWFLRESRYLNYARFSLGTSCAVSGTGFLFSKKVAEEIRDWPFHLLTEDIEFSIDQITKGRKIAFCERAELYDEQPMSFTQSWTQRMRWARGYLQVFGKYGGKLIRGIFHGSFSCFDMSMNIMPAFILTAASLVCNISLGIVGAMQGEDLMVAVRSLGETFGNMYLMLWFIGFVTTVTEWKHIHAKVWQKLLYLFTFPIFMFTYLPISIAAMFCDCGWKPIRHTVAVKEVE